MDPVSGNLEDAGQHKTRGTHESRLTKVGQSFKNDVKLDIEFRFPENRYV